eukprot:9660612-Alexandrium_andersonii.AAC.1
MNRRSTVNRSGATPAERDISTSGPGSALLGCAGQPHSEKHHETSQRASCCQPTPNTSPPG